MTDERDICERLEDRNIDGAIFLRINAAKDIRALRHYVAQLEDHLAKVEIGLEKTVIKLEKAWDYSSKQAVDIVTLGQEVGRLREALENVLAWQDAVDVCAPELGGLLLAMYRARATLAEQETK